MSDPRIEVLDLEHQGVAGAIAAFLIFGPEGPVLVETGPARTLETLYRRLGEHGVAPSEVKHVLVTHIHLDHSGAAGWLAQAGAEIYVHPVGAPHLVDPSKLLASAGRIYGDDMEPLWGEIVPAPEARVHLVTDGETIEAGGLGFTAMETPGHAWHHHVYRLGDVAFTGDAVGIRIDAVDWLELPAPPPEFNLEVWKATLEKLRGAEIATIYRTHFGPAGNVGDEIDAFEHLLDISAEFVRDMVVDELPREEMIPLYNEWIRGRLAKAGIDEHTAHAYETANPRYMSVDGLAKYWRKRV